MNWRDPPLKERLVWRSEHELKHGKYFCYHCGEQLWFRYVREVWANKNELFVRRFHVKHA